MTHQPDENEWRQRVFDPMARTVTRAILAVERAHWLADRYALPVPARVQVPLCAQQIPAEGTE